MRIEFKRGRETLEKVKVKLQQLQLQQQHQQPLQLQQQHLQPQPLQLQQQQRQPLQLQQQKNTTTTATVTAARTLTAIKWLETLDSVSDEISKLRKKIAWLKSFFNLFIL